MKLSVIIVNYNVKFYLEQCLCSLYRSLNNIKSEVFVVDNASTDDSQEYIEQRFPDLTYIYNKQNVGFSSANNQAIQLAQGEYILLLNPDTVLPEDLLEKVLSFMETTPRAGAAGVRMITSDGSFLPESKRRKPSPLASMGKLTGLSRLFPRSSHLGGYYYSNLSEEEINPVEVLPGAFMMIRNSALQKAGLLDENFFMYGEDIDLSCRLLDASFLNYYLPYLLLHYKGESTNTASRRYIDVFYDAMLIFFSKQQHEYNAMYRNFIKAGIYFRKGIALAELYIKKLTRLFITRKEKEIRFLFLGNEDNFTQIDEICRNNQLSAQHRYVTADEQNFPDGHGCFWGELNNFTHIVYDIRAYSFSKILYLLSLYHKEELKIGLYNSESRVLVTPEKCYTLP